MKLLRIAARIAFCTALLSGLGLAFVPEASPAESRETPTQYAYLRHWGGGHGHLIDY